jgi:hypothetical protein
MYAEQPLVAATVVTYGVTAFGIAALAAVSMSRSPRLASIRLHVKSSE